MKYKTYYYDKYMIVCKFGYDLQYITRVIYSNSTSYDWSYFSTFLGRVWGIGYKANLKTFGI